MKNRYVLLADLPMIALAACGAFIARFDWAFYRRAEFVPFLVAALLIKPVVFLLLGMYRRYWQYTSLPDMAVVLTAVSAAAAAMGVFVVVALAAGMDEFSRVVIVNDWLLTLAAVSGLRVAIRVLSENGRGPRRQSSADQRVLIVGAGAAGTMVAREMRRNPHLGMMPIGFVDDDRVKIGKRLAGLPVFGSRAALRSIVDTQRVDSVVIAMPTAAGSVVRTIVTMCAEAGVKSQTIPGMFELLNGQVDVNRLRTVDITDLLRRAPVSRGHDAGEFLAGHVVMVTGGGGSIGSELARQIANATPSQLVVVGHGENSIFDVAQSLRRDFPHVAIAMVIADIRDEARLASVFERVRPQIVFHAAAHKHVPLMEENPEEAITNNVIGTRNVVRCALACGTERLVLISTDKAVAPTSIMGASKRLAETIVRQAARRTGRAFVAVRFGNVLGSRGSVVHTFKQQIERGGPITVTHPDMTRYFMTIPEAVHLVLEASGVGRGGELFVLDMGAPVKIVDLARDLIKLSGLSEDEIPIVFTGVRPGEKMEERLCDIGMELRTTEHPHILEVAGEDPIDVDLDTLVAHLADAARQGDRETIDMLLGTAVQSFASRRAWPIADRPVDVRLS